MKIRKISQENRHEVNNFISDHWFSTDMVARGEIVDMTKLPGFAVYEDEEIIALVTYRIIDGECEIMSLDSLKKNQGIGGALVKKVVEVSFEAGCSKIKLITTNDNINALRFYQKRGFDMVNIYRNALDVSRRLKPSIPMIGDFGIPLKHEIELEMSLKQ